MITFETPIPFRVYLSSDLYQEEPECSVFRKDSFVFKCKQIFDFFLYFEGNDYAFDFLCRGYSALVHEGDILEYASLTLSKDELSKSIKWIKIYEIMKELYPEVFYI